MNNYLTRSLVEVDNFLENDLLLQKDHIINKALHTSKGLNKYRKSFFIDKSKVKKDPNEFSSLERIRIVVDSLTHNGNIDEICSKEGITRVTYLTWKRDFLEAFKQYSEEVLIKENNNKKYE